MHALPAVRRLTPDITAVSRPARTFTGDFYFTHETRDRVWFALGDVAGKGLPAAIVMAMIQEELEERIASCAAHACDPAATVTRLHEFLMPLMPQNRFATAVVGHLQDDGRLTIVNAGHCSPLIVRRDGSVEVLPSTGPILGILPHARWSSYATKLEQGETLLLFSDGVTDATCNGEDIGMDGVISLVRKVGPSPAAIANAIGVSSDDVTLIALTA